MDFCLFISIYINIIFKLLGPDLAPESYPLTGHLPIKLQTIKQSSLFWTSAVDGEAALQVSSAGCSPQAFENVKAAIPKESKVRSF